MPDLPARPDLDQLRHQGKDLLQAAKSGDGDHESLARIRAVANRLTLQLAQLAIAPEYEFPVDRENESGDRATRIVQSAKYRPGGAAHQLRAARGNGEARTLLRPPGQRDAARLHRHAALRCDGTWPRGGVRHNRCRRRPRASEQVGIRRRKPRPISSGALTRAPGGRPWAPG